MYSEDFVNYWTNEWSDRTIWRLGFKSAVGHVQSRLLWCRLPRLMRLECLSFCPSTSNCLIWSNRSEADDFFVPEDFIGRTGLDWPPGRTTGGAMKDAPPLAIVYIFLERVKTNQLIELSITCKWHHSVCKYWPSSLISEALWVLTLSPITTFCFVFIYSGKFEMRMLWNALWTTTLYLLQLTWNWYCTRAQALVS